MKNDNVILDLFESVIQEIEKIRQCLTHDLYKELKILQEITELPESSLEKSEKLEQLRWLENGKTIAITETSIESISVDTPEDLVRANGYLIQLNNS